MKRLLPRLARAALWSITGTAAAVLLLWAWGAWTQPAALLQLLSGFSLCG